VTRENALDRRSVGVGFVRRCGRLARRAAKDDRGHDPLRRQRIERRDSVAGGQPPGPGHAVEMGDGRVRRVCRRDPPPALQRLSHVRRRRERLPAPGARWEQIRIRQERGNQMVRRCWCHEPPPLRRGLDQRRPVAFAGRCARELPHHRDEAIDATATRALGPGDGRRPPARVDDDTSAHCGGAVPLERPHVPAPGRSPDATVIEYTHAAVACDIEQRVVERDPVEVPAVPERVEHEVGLVEPVAAPGAPDPVRGPVALRAERAGPEDVGDDALAPWRQALTPSGGARRRGRDERHRGSAAAGGDRGRHPRRSTAHNHDVVGGGHAPGNHWSAP